MKVLVLKNTSSKAGGHRAGEVLDLPEDVVAKLPEFYRPAGEQRDLEADKQREVEQKATVAHEDRIQRKLAMSRDTADRKSAEADKLMNEAAHRLKLAEEARRQADTAHVRSSGLAAAAPAPNPVPTPISKIDAPEALPPHKRAKRTE